MSASSRIQEWFNIAYKGLASQGWKQCLINRDICSYNNDKGMHCAWGWVDKDTWHLSSAIPTLLQNDMGTTLLKSASQYELEFAIYLQRAHDWSADPQTMRDRMTKLAHLYKLTVPDILNEQ